MRLTLLVLFLYVFLGIGALYSQEVSKSKSLTNKANAIFELLRSDPEKAFIEASNVHDEAIFQNNHEAELVALNIICAYYTKKSDFENLIISSENLYAKADLYNKLTYKVIAKNNISQAYMFNNLNEKAFEQLEQGLAIINKVDTSDSIVIDTKSNLYISFSNYYSLQNDNINRLKYIKLAITEHEKFDDVEYKKRLQYIDYSNLALAYYEQDLDSAEIYAQKSILFDKDHDFGDVSLCNLIVLGGINQKRKNYTEALSYYHRGEQIENYKNHLNVEHLYQNIIEVYKTLHDTENVKKYENKLYKFKFKVSENKNNALHKIIEEKEVSDRSKTYQLFLIASIVLIGVLLFFAFLVVRKNIILARFEKNSQKYLDEKAAELNEPSKHDFTKLVEMVKNNDLAFLSSFHEVFPDFSKKLQTINPKIVQTEIEFCALLKLNISSKEIARYRNIEHRTVQNKKYLIRKKLNIPNEMDIYHWFNNV